MNEQNPKVGPTHRHAAPKPFQMAIGDSENIEVISQHIEHWIGKPATVFHELVSDKVHIDVHIVAPAAARPYYSLVTSGMSNLPMRALKSHPDWAYAELFLCLPPDWKMGDNDLKSDEYYWPIKALKYLARFPHQYDTWLWYGHTIPNGDPPEPFNNSTQFSSLILLNPSLLPADFHELRINSEKTIRFFSVVPLYADELAAKLKNGAGMIENAIKANGYSELIDVRRKSIIPEPSLFARLFKRRGNFQRNWIPRANFRPVVRP